ncbi:oligosaccharide flippase family protein, partial [Rhizobium ruizarguesonis]
MMTVSAAIAKVRSLLMNQAVLLLNAGMLGLGTLMTAILGFVYWWLAARSFSAEAVGLAAAAISLMNLLANLGEVGLGPFLMGEIGRQKRAGPFLTGALLASF